jgi:chaperonin cofactor prefoldin
LDKVEDRLDAIEGRLASLEREVRSIRHRIENLEEQGASQAGYAQEIDYLLERVAKIEKHLKLS